MDYDVLILGGGIIGCAIAYELAQYNINIALIEKDYDVADDISFSNTEVIYDGSETSNEIMSKLENIGMNLIYEHCKKYNVPYKKTGALRISDSEEGNKKIELIYNRAKERGISGVHIIEDGAIYDIEPNLKIKVDKALYCENIAVISPYNLAISYAEVAADNGVNFKLEEKVLEINTLSKGFKIVTNKNKFTCKFVINTIPNEISAYSTKDALYEGNSKRMDYLLFNENIDNCTNSVIINDIDKDSFAINIPTFTKANLIGISSDKYININEMVNVSKTILNNVKKQDLANVFTEEYRQDSIFIDDSKINEGYLKIKGSHYGKITISPAIAIKVVNIIKKSMNIVKKNNFIDKKRESYVFRNLSKDQRNELISIDKRYGKIICSCNNITEGEIVDCIRRPLGARTLKGVKRRTGVGMGRCNGSYCNMKIIKILAREMNKNVLSIVDDSMESKILASRIKEFNEV